MVSDPSDGGDDDVPAPSRMFWCPAGHWRTELTSQDWVRVGAPLIEQDAEFLRTLIEEEGYPCKLERIRDTDNGRNFAVKVERKHLEYAGDIRAKNFTDGAPNVTEARPTRFGLISLITSGAGFVVGAPLGWILKGTSLVAVMGGAVFAMCAFLRTLVYGAARMSDGVQARTSNPEVQVGVRKPGQKR